MIRKSLAVALLAGPAFAGTLDPTVPLTDHFDGKSRPRVVEILKTLLQQCKTEMNGTLEIDDMLGVVYTDLDGDNGEIDYTPDDAVIDLNHIYCSGGNLWGGSGGAPIHLVLDSTTSASWTAGGWDVVRTRNMPSVILLARHGSACDGYGAQTCVQAITVDEGGFLTVRSPESSEE